MNQTDSIPNDTPCISCPRDWAQAELESRSGGLVREALQGLLGIVKQTHWDDMR